MRVHELPETPLSGVVLHCPKCGADASAYRGDYFLFAPTTVVKCRKDRRVLVLVRKVEYYEPVSVEEASDE